MYDEHENSIRVLGEYKLVRTDPFNFWKIEALSGKTPSELSGISFTNTREASVFLKTYLEREGSKPKPKKAREAA